MLFPKLFQMTALNVCAKIVFVKRSPSNERLSPETVGTPPVGSAPNDVFAVGAQGTILHYDGATWTAMISPTTRFLRAVWGSSGTDVIAVGGGGTIVRFDGTSWTAQTSGTTETLRGVWGAPETPAPGVFAVGNTGTILLGAR